MKTLMLPFLFCLICTNAFSQSAEKPNFIFIICDDLNDWVEGFNTEPQTNTPNILALGQKGTTFLNAFSNCVVCAPSRTSMLTGKTLHYTGVNNNEEYNCDNFRSNFDTALFIETLPQYLKDSAGYFTYSIDKLFHCPQNFQDYDNVTEDICAKEFSWNKCIDINNGPGLGASGTDNPEGVEHFSWSKIDSAFTPLMQDYIATDSAAQFIRAYHNDPSQFCNKPFFISIGYHKPHSNLFVPGQYFSSDYIDDFYAQPFNIPYNDPKGSYPPNGLIMPPQPAVAYSDYDSLGELGKYFASPFVHNDFTEWGDTITPLPEFNAALSEAEIREMLSESKRANGVMAYLAAIRFVDEQVGRFMDSLMQYPELYNNSILIFTSDHGYAMDEKKHYEKLVLWETVTRIPMIICDLRDPKAQICNRTVGLLDIYPTLCDYAGVQPPVFPDQTDYLDGKSMLALMEDPSLIRERPVLSFMKNEADRDGSCNEQYSVRNEQYHYIRYQSDGGDASISCDDALSITEEELYEIGAHRETDPNEWKNLIHNADYFPVAEYMNSFLPDHENYLQSVFTSVIHTDENAPCLYALQDQINLTADLFDASGNPVDISVEPDYLFQWTNNLTDQVLNGSAVSFDMQNISSGLFSNHDHILFYLHVRDLSANKIVAFSTMKIFINPDHAPFVNYCVLLNDLTATVSSYQIQGAATSSVWDFDTGITIPAAVPGPYTYQENGTYTIKNVIGYGNGCIATFPFKIFTDKIDIDSNTISCFVFPDPASSVLQVQTSQPLTIREIKIYNIVGQLVHTEQYCCETDHFLVEVSALRAGNYILHIVNDDNSIQQRFTIAR